ncbi:GspE/PulE family protein [Zavarzinia sp. CC-PAN008]|uniref:GspE/PulE family protein n=1 Tax=Zavarzinia sp. CC-PAN008 TaxID=3243332 RepID=UPI003F742FC6
MDDETAPLTRPGVIVERAANVARLVFPGSRRARTAPQLALVDGDDATQAETMPQAVAGSARSLARAMPPPVVAPVAPRPTSPFIGGISADLVAAGLLTERRAVSLALKARETGQTLVAVLAQDASAADLDAIYALFAAKLGTELISRNGSLLDQVAEVPWLPLPLAEQRGVLVLADQGPDCVRYAATDPFDLITRDWIARQARKAARPVPVLPGVFLDAISRLRIRQAAQDDGKMLVPIDITWQQEEEIRGRLETCDVPLIVDFVLHRAYEQGASDIHIEPVEDGTVVRTRIDGMLHEECRLPLALHPAVTSRIKILAGMDVAERRRPQDGRITVQIRRLPLDIRVSSLPTVSGEKIVMRLLDEKALRPTPEKLGLREQNLRLLLDKITAPHGLVMLSGPTGSGKTTTLYSCLSAIDRHRRNVLTIEDPVEYRLKGVHQMQVNERIGLTFANGLRTILRQDPDVVMVGECRDVETAKMAIQASLTGHVVFSTIHANDAVGVISRLLDMRIDPFLVATSLSLAIAQRLMRVACPSCRITVEGHEVLAMLRADSVSEQKLRALGIEIDPRSHTTHAPGCPQCRHTGYAGRQAVFEMFEVTEDLRDLIAAETFSAEDLRRAVRRAGMVGMVEHALQLVDEEVTTYAEVVRVFGDGAG